MYNKDQPRVPKGNPNGGQWTSADQLAAAIKKYSSPSEYERCKLDLGFFGHKKVKTELNFEEPLTPPKEAYGFLNKERLNTKHHRAHAKEMGFKNQDDYERAAIYFWERGDGTVYVSKLEKRFYRYNEKTQFCVSVSPDGIIHTFLLLKKRVLERIKKQEKWDVY